MNHIYGRGSVVSESDRFKRFRVDDHALASVPVNIPLHGEKRNVTRAREDKASPILCVHPCL